MSEDQIVEEITIEAPVERVWAALVDPEQRRRWWGGEKYRVVRIESDLRVGGQWAMRFEGWGKETGMRGEYRVVEPPRVLEFSWRPDWYAEASESVVRLELRAHAGATHIRLTHSGLASEADRANHRGWAEILSWLGKYVETAVSKT
ncbi:MAG: SRPBCC family protein [Terriglobales bacterium]